MAEHIVVSVENRILTLRLDRPEKKNALTRGMYLGMIEALKQADSRPKRARGFDHGNRGLLHSRK